MLHPCRLKTMLLIVLAAFAFSLSSVAQVGTCTSASCWSYSSPTGPSSWAGLTPFAYCNQANNAAQQQSPINIGTPQVNTSLTLAINYNGVQVPVEDLGYTIEADYGSGSSQNYVTYGGTKYNLLQFHFHQPSEHQIGVDRRKYGSAPGPSGCAGKWKHGSKRSLFGSWRFDKRTNDRRLQPGLRQGHDSLPDP